MLNLGGVSSPGGGVNLGVTRGTRPVRLPVSELLKRGLPGKNVGPAVNNWRRANLFNLLRGVRKVWVAERMDIATYYGALYLSIIRPTGNISDLLKEYVDLMPGMNFVTWAQVVKGAHFRSLYLGLASTRVVTTAGVGYIVDAFQDSVEVENLRYHGLGTGSTAENASDTALVTELTTEYTGNVRATGTLTEGASANIFRTVGTNTMDETPGAALREHGIFSQAATGGGTLLDRTVFAAITLNSGDSLASTFDLTLPSGS